MKIKCEISEDTLEEWIDDRSMAMDIYTLHILDYAVENFYKNVLDSYVPQDSGVLYDTVDYIIKSTQSGGNITLRFSGEENPPKQRMEQGWYKFLPDKPYALYQYYEGKQGTNWLEEPLDTYFVSVILNDISLDVWEVLENGVPRKW
ncbi:MAG: hypothetical protein HUJ56_11495 [Erysipelotrichaceae bacterium]|nr:hypothetical protein [Erysipelotrichaceae bacterium]